MRLSTLPLLIAAASSFRSCSRTSLTATHNLRTTSFSSSTTRTSATINNAAVIQPSAAKPTRKISLLRNAMKSRGVQQQLTDDTVMSAGDSSHDNIDKNNEEDAKAEVAQPVYVFKSGSVVKVKVTQFGPLGASISINNGEAKGLILQREIAMFRDTREGRDVEVGEELDGYIQMIREDGRVNVGLRPVGMNRIPSIREAIIDALEGSPDGTIPIGDKSSPDDISAYFHGLSKSDFRKAVGTLFKEGFLIPSAFELKLNNADELPAPSARAASMASLGSPVGLHSADSDSSADARVFSKNKFTVFVGNLPSSATEKILSNTIEKFVGKGKMLSLRMPVDATSKPKGFAFVNFECVESKDVAMSKLKGYELMGRALRIEDGDAPKREKEQSSLKEPSVGTPKLWSKPGAGVSLEEIMSFGYSGKDESNGSERNNHDGSAGSRGTVDQRRVEATLFFGNLAYAVDEAMLRDTVERVVGQGAVVNARIATDMETGRKKGFGYVDFANQDDAEKALDEMKGMSVKGRPLKVDDATRRRY